jgi:hypothetical protein
VCPIPLLRPRTISYRGRLDDRLDVLNENVEERWDWLPAQQKRKRLRSTIQLKRRDPTIAGDHEARVDDWVVTNRELVPVVPSLLMVLVCCRGMAEPSLADAFHQRGTKFVLGVRLAPRPKQWAGYVSEFLTTCHNADFTQPVILDAFRKLMAKRTGTAAWPEPRLSIHPAVGLPDHQDEEGMILGAQNLPTIAGGSIEREWRRQNVPVMDDDSSDSS